MRTTTRHTTRITLTKRNFLTKQQIKQLQTATRKIIKKSTTPTQAVNALKNLCKMTEKLARTGKRTILRSVTKSANVRKRH